MRNAWLVCPSPFRSAEISSLPMGLVNNAAFVVAPRTHTRGVNFQGRSFLHDCDYTRDTAGSVLELIMTAPMVVTH